MSSGLRLMLLLGCAMLALLEAPRCGLVLMEDLSGPYPQSGHELESASLESAMLAAPAEELQAVQMQPTQAAEETTKQ